MPCLFLTHNLSLQVSAIPSWMLPVVGWVNFPNLHHEIIPVYCNFCENLKIRFGRFFIRSTPAVPKLSTGNFKFFSLEQPQCYQIQGCLTKQNQPPYNILFYNNQQLTLWRARRIGFPIIKRYFAGYLQTCFSFNYLDTYKVDKRLAK